MDEPQQKHIERRKPSSELEVINQRLNYGDERMNRIEENQAAGLEALRQNTVATNQIAENTAGLVELSNDLAAGTRFMCRCASFVRFALKDVIEPFWKPCLIVFCVIYWVTHEHSLPAWLSGISKLVAG